MTKSDVLLVGSLPYESAEEAFRAAGPALDGHAGWLPDGEPGPRQMWVGMLLALVYSQHPDIDETKAPPEHGLAPPDPNEPQFELEGGWLFRVKPGRTIRFDDLKYGKLRDGVVRGLSPAARRGPRPARRAVPDEPAVSAQLDRRRLR